MTKLTDIQTQVYKYDTMIEMMGHIAAMGAAGWTLQNVSEVYLQATYRKSL